MKRYRKCLRCVTATRRIGVPFITDRRLSRTNVASIAIFEKRTLLKRSRATYWSLCFSHWQILSRRFTRFKFRCCRCAVQQHLQSTAVSSSITQIIHFSEKKNFVEDSKCCLFGTLFLYLGFSIRTFCSVPVALPSCAALCCNVSTRVFHGSFILNYEDYRSFRKKELC